MKSTFLSLLLIATVLLVPATSLGAPSTQETTMDLSSSITVLGYGTASAVPDSARVNLYIGERPTYGPGDPAIMLVSPGDMEEMRDSLVQKGVKEQDIQINLLSRNYALGPSGFVGEIVFTYSQVDELSGLLQALLDEQTGRRGPYIQGADVLFQVDDCAALEETAMKAALDEARNRATRMAELLELSPGRVISVSEDLSSAGLGPQVGGCIALEGLTSSRGFSFLGISGAMANTPSEVEVGIMLKTTFALEQ